MRKILFLLTAAVLLAAALSVYAQNASGGIVVTADAKNANPTLVFTGGLSDQALSEKILSDFQNCDWFTVLKSGKATYQVSAKGTLQDFTVTVSCGGVPEYSFRIKDSKDVDSAAHTAVDTVLNRVFGIRGICNSKIVFSAYTNAKNREIFICDFDGKNIKKLTDYNTLCVQPVWAFDGKSFVYIHYNSSYTTLMQYNMELGLSRRLAVSAGGSLSPDGKTLAMTNNVDLFTRPTESSSKPKQITGGKSAETSPRWSPDGKKLCFVSDASAGRPLLFTIDPFEGGKPVMISGLVGSERVAPSWSTDNKLAYCAKIGRNYELRVAKLSADGKSGVMEEIGVAGKDTFQGEDPSWAPDNRHVTLTMGNAICVIDTRLGTKRTLVTGTRELGHSSWSPILK